MPNSNHLPVYKLPTEIAVKGATASDGTPYLRVTASGLNVWLPRSAFTGSGTEALHLLKAANIPMLPHEWAQCKKNVAQVTLYPAKPLIDRPGWNGEHFALADGTVFSPTSKSKPVVLFAVNTQKCAAAGSISTWRKLTALLEHQPLATFVVLAAFAGPFLALTHQVMNYGFELSGPPGKGKSTLQRLAAAVCGPADNPLGHNYWLTANATINGLESAMAAHNDMPLILEEFNLYASGEPAATRARKINEFVFKLSDGTEKLRFGGGDPKRSRLMFITSTNEPCSQPLLGYQAAVAEAAADRLLTLPIGSDRPYGIFDRLPPGFADSGELAEHFNKAVRVCHGVGIRKLLERLVVERAKDPEGIARRLQRSMDYFRRKVGVDCNDGSKTRVADAFALIYAVGRFAVRYGAVSSKVNPLKAALACYRLHQTTRAKPLKPAEQLRKMADCWETLDVRHDQLRELTDAEIDDACAIVREGRGGQLEILLTDAQLKRAFPNVRAFYMDPEIRRMVIPEPGRKQTKRRIRLNRRGERFHCFRLPELNER